MNNKLLLILVIAFSSLTASAQNLEFFTGPDKSVYQDHAHKDDFHFHSSYDPKLGFCAGISADSIRLGWFKLRFTLQFDQLHTDLMESYELLGGGKTVCFPAIPVSLWIVLGV
jgi:hypothetical protein